MPCLERYRKSKKSENERLCKLCTTNEIENENHFMFSCPVFTQRRKDFVDSLLDIDTTNFFTLSETEKLKLVMSQKQIRQTAIYVTDLYKARCQIIYNKKSSV